MEQRQTLHKWLEQLDIYRQKNTTTYLDTDLTSFAKINSKLTLYLNVKHKMIKLPDDKIEYTLTLGMAMTC